MRHGGRWVLLAWLVLGDAWGGDLGAVATGHPVATRAAVEVLQSGGNAIDAAVAAALTLGVVDGHNSGIGGGCFVVAHLAGGRLVALDGRETAPAGATREMFVRDGEVMPEASLTGALAVGVPGQLAALEALARRHGRWPLARGLERAAALAEAGMEVTPGYAARLRGEAAALRQFPESAAIFLRSDGSGWEAGEILRQPDLAATYRAIAAGGTRWFYRGPFAQRLEAWMRANGGVLTRRDLRRYRVRWREPVITTYRGWTVAGFPPPSSGGVHVGQILRMLEGFEVGALGAGSADLAHLLGEAMKRAFADRAHWLGDPDFVRVPKGLVDAGYGAALAKGIRMDRAVPVEGHGEPPGGEVDAFGKRHTTHLSVADADGNWVALTATINTSFGSKAVVPGTGVLLNNQMDDFSVRPGATNFFGLVGAEANAIAPRKRPLSSMSPTLLLRDDAPVLAVGAAGGPTIISQTVRAVVAVVDFGATTAEALAAARVHHQWRPDTLVMEGGWDDAAEGELEARGHRVRRVPALGAAQAVGRRGGRWEAAADARGEGSGAVATGGR